MDTPEDWNNWTFEVVYENQNKILFYTPVFNLDPKYFYTYGIELSPVKPNNWEKVNFKTLIYEGWYSEKVTIDGTGILSLVGKNILGDYIKERPLEQGDIPLGK